MAITRDGGRQYPLIGRIEVDGTATTGNVSVVGVYPAMDVPPNTIVIGGGFNITTIFTATVDIDVGDGVDPDEYTPTIIEGDALGYTALVATGYKYTEADTIDVSIVVADTIVGIGELIVMYIVDDRANESAD
jgi:hypothetical protein